MVSMLFKRPWTWSLTIIYILPSDSRQIIEGVKILGQAHVHVRHTHL